MKTKPIFVILMSIVMVSACGPGAIAPSPLTPQPMAARSDTPTATLKPKSTPTSTLTSTQTPTKTNTPTFTPLPFAYETKQVLLNYYFVGSHTLFDIAVEPMFSSLVVYSDGQIIISGETKTLSPAEMDQLFAQLKGLGFYDIETDEQGLATPNLYTPDNPFEKITDATSYCVLTTTEDKKIDICAYEPYMQYLIPAMQHTLKFLDDYHPKGMKPYSPDRILLYVESPETSQVLDKDALSKRRVIPWSVDLLLLKPNLDYKVTYVQGPMAARIASYLYSFPFSDRPLFQQNGINYFVDMDILLPHEEVYFSAVQ
jgi:hypothetical protein